MLAGAEFVDADANIPETVVVDGNLVRTRMRRALGKSKSCSFLGLLHVNKPWLAHCLRTPIGGVHLMLNTQL